MGLFHRIRKYKPVDNQPSFGEIFEDYASNHNQTKEVVKQVLKFYKIKGKEIPDDIEDLAEEFNRLFAGKNLATRQISLGEVSETQFDEPIIVFTKEKGVPAVIYPLDNMMSCFVDPFTGVHYVMSRKELPGTQEKALSFYHPLPQRKITFKDYVQYIKGCLRPIDGIVVVLMIAAVAAIGLVNPYLLKKLTGEVVESKDMNLFYAIAIQITGIYIATLILHVAQGIINARISIKTERALHSALMRRVLSAPSGFFKAYNTGELTARINSISQLYSLIIDGVFIVGLTSLMSLVQLIQIRAFAANLVLPTLAIVMTNALFLTFNAVLERRVMRRQVKAVAKERGVAYGLINGIQKIRLTGSEKEAYEKWERAYQELDRAKYKPPILVRLAPAISISISLAGNVLLYYLVAKNNLDASSYIAFLSSYAILAGAMLNSSKVVGNATKIKPLREMINPILEAEPESDDSKLKVDSIQGNIRIDNVSFQYKEGDTLVLNGISIDIKEGEYIAVVGKTGCGKSTLVRLLLGLEKPTSGHIYYDDIDMADLHLQSLRKKIGSVTQNGQLFHADILSNIIITAPTLQEKDAWEAAKIACVDQDIKEMPMKMKTIISEGQGGISGGQKQRLMIARAIVNKPKVLIFDEATSSLDNEAQKQVSESIAKLNCTRIVIAHRLSTIKECDRILYLEGGKIVEEGTYEELVSRPTKFKDLVEKQRI